MTRRTDPADVRSCALVLDELVNQVRALPAAQLIVRTKPELKHLLDAATAALAGVSMARFRCTRTAPKRCEWSGLFPDRFPEGFACARCGSRDGEAVR